MGAVEMRGLVEREEEIGDERECMVLSCRNRC